MEEQFRTEMAIYQQTINIRLWEMPDSFINVFVHFSDKLQLFFDFVQQDEADMAPYWSPNRHL
jgi:hypothetical protein